MPKLYAIATETKEHGIRYVFPKWGSISISENIGCVYNNFDDMMRNLKIASKSVGRKFIGKDIVLIPTKFFPVRLNSKHYKQIGKLKDGNLATIRYIK